MAKIERYCWSIFGLRQPSQATQQAHPKSLSRFYPASHTLSVRGRDQSADHTKHKVYKLNKPGQGRPLGRVYLWLKVFGVWYTNHGLNFLITKGLKNQLGEGVMVSLESAPLVSFVATVNRSLTRPAQCQRALRAPLLTPGCLLTPLVSLEKKHMSQVTESRRRIDVYRHLQMDSRKYTKNHC